MRRGFQIVQGLRIEVIFPVKELDGALVLQAAIDSHLLARPLRFKRDARHFDVQRDGDGCGHHEHQQQRETRLAVRFASGVSSGHLRFQWQCLLVVALELRIFHHGRIYADANNLVALLDHVAFGRDHDILAIQEKRALIARPWFC